MRRKEVRRIATLDFRDRRTSAAATLYVTQVPAEMKHGKDLRPNKDGKPKVQEDIDEDDDDSVRLVTLSCRVCEAK